VGCEKTIGASNNLKMLQGLIFFVMQTLLARKILLCCGHKLSQKILIYFGKSQKKPLFTKPIQPPKSTQKFDFQHIKIEV
jgi:hypothetical protein